MRQTIRAYYRIAGGNQPIYLEYPVEPTPRYGSGHPPHAILREKIGQNRGSYRSTLTRLLDFGECYSKIPLGPTGQGEPHWNNGSLPPLDAMSLYSLLARGRSRRYVEIGSGHSTKFARRAITDLALPTTITSIDPLPRAEIDPLCDDVVRQPLERIDPSWAETLDRGDILFFDGSHRCFENSDVSVFFLDVLPRLKAGVVIELHDIFLPFDYPSPWNANFWSEQYLLASYLLAGDTRLGIVLPNAFISQDEELRSTLEPLWNSLHLSVGQWPGVSFWAEIR